MTETEITYPHIVYVEDANTQIVFVPQPAPEPPDPEPPDPEPPDPTPTDGACATICMGGHEYDFPAADGEALDPYVDPAGDFIMDNIACRHPNLPNVTAYYRPDRTSNREEWVFHLGPAFETTQANLSAYSVRITDRAGATHTIDADKGHFWFARWRWQSAPRPVRRSYQSLAASNLIPHFNTAGLVKGNILSVSGYTPMALCGLPASQSQTGGYPGLGLTTGWIAQYLARNAPEDSFRRQAEATNSYNSFVLDPDTHGPLDLIDVWPTANMYSASEGQPFVNKGPNPNRTDTGHLPSTVYIPFLLTGDPYHLEAMQFTANYQMLSQPSDSRFMIAGRYFAWPTRAIAECVAATPDSVPAWLLPRAYWERWLGILRGYVEDRAVNASDPYLYCFHTILESGQSSDLDPSKSGDHVWQQGMVDLTTAWIASWRPEWVEPAEWCIHSCIDRASDTSGWCRKFPSPYHVRLQHASCLDEPMTKADQHFVLQYPQLGFAKGVQVKIDSEIFTLDGTVDGLTWTFEPRVSPADHAAKRPVYGPKCTSWSEAADLNCATYGWDTSGDPDALPESVTDCTYQSYQRAALAQALHAQLDVPGLQDAYTWLDGEIRRKVAEGGAGVGDNWCVVPSPGRRRRHRRRTDRTDTDKLQRLLDEIRGVDE